jgi:lysophospholipase L1-like esterase
MAMQKIRIVATGDSMTDTAGEGCPALANELGKSFPDKEFEIINQGVGGTRVGYGLWRLENEYEFRDRKNPPLISLEPDIVLLESFSYNNGSDGLLGDGLAHFREMHFKIVEKLRAKTKAQIVFVVTIAPEKERFLESVPNFINTPVSIRKWMAEDRVAYLEEAIKIAHDLELPLADVYHASLEAAENGESLSKFINPVDWIHPGEEGHKLAAKVIVETFKKHKLIV